MGIVLDPEQDSVLNSGLIATLSRALDLAEGEPMGHGIRSCWIGMEISKSLTLSSTQQSELFYALLLKDAGCSVNAAQVTQWFGTNDQEAKRNLKTVNWSNLYHASRYAIQNARPGAPMAQRVAQMVALARRGPNAARQLVQMRCTRGADVVRSLGWASLAPDAVLNLDEHWDGSGSPRGLTGSQIPLLARILLLAQTIEIFWNRKGPEAAMRVVAERRGAWFDPELAQVALTLGSEAGFWQRLGEVAGPQAIVALDPHPVSISLASADALLPVARVFAEIVDAKSPWTARHSERTARYAGLLARQVGAAESDARQLELAGLYHDLGKLGVPNLVLDKPGRLSPDEFRVVQRHPALTYEILAPLAPLRPTAVVASAHHERLDGSGYHQGLRGSELPEGAMLVAMADVFDALTSPRPYKPGMEPDDALRVMEPDAGTKLPAETFLALRDLVRSGAVTVPSLPMPHEQEELGHV